MTSKTAQRKMRVPNPDSKHNQDGDTTYTTPPNTTTEPPRTRPPISNQEHIPKPPSQPANMSFLGLGGRAQPTSAEKIAAVENELKVMSEMHSR